MTETLGVTAGLPQEDVADTGLQAEAIQSYWGVEDTYRFELSNGQYFEIRPLDEGGKAKYQKMTNKGIHINRKTDDARLNHDPAEERHTLIKLSVVDWMLYRPDGKGGMAPWPCPENATKRSTALNEFLHAGSPKMIQDLELFIRKHNPWMQADMTVEDIDLEIERLQELRVQVEGEGSSASK